jgi:hypothetical protein
MISVRTFADAISSFAASKNLWYNVNLIVNSRQLRLIVCCYISCHILLYYGLTKQNEVRWRRYKVQEICSKDTVREIADV